jgi:putative addiction module component (TIGR02574 family)
VALGRPVPEAGQPDNVLSIRATENSLAAPPEAKYPSFMTSEDVRALPVDLKIQIMEAIWEDFRERFERSEISPEQKQLLDRRRARVRDGAARLLDWDSVKGTLGKP